MRETMIAVKTIFGSMDIGRRTSVEEGIEMLNVFAKNGHKEIDTAFLYAEEKAEIYLGNMVGSIDRDLTFATKANPLDGKGLGAASVRHQLETSLMRMKRQKVQIFYLHAPDHNTPLEETLGAVDAHHKEGKFNEFGLCNYSSWLVAEVMNICKKNGYVTPTVYQGMYSVVARMVEKELFSCLRYYGIKFYAYSPLAGGILSGKHKMNDESKSEPGRFFGSSKCAMNYRNMYWKKGYFDAVEEIAKSLSRVYGEDEVSVPEAAYRWLYYHSELKGKCGDGVVIGATSIKQLEKNLTYTKKGPPHDDVVTFIDSIWGKISRLCPDYAR